MNQLHPIEENETLSKAIQASLDTNNIPDAIQYVCEWEQYTAKKNKRTPNFGHVTKELLGVFGINVNMIWLR